MSNKIYIKLKKFIKENGIFLVIFVFLYVILTIKLPYSIESPGGTINTDKRLINKVYSSNGSINLTYVSFLRGTIPTLLLSIVMPEWDVVKDSEVTLDGESIEDSFKRDQISLKSSISISQYIAYKNAGIDIKPIKSENLVTYLDKECISDLNIGDDILKYDSIDFEDSNLFKEYILNKNVGDKIEFVVLNNNKEENRYAIIRDVSGDKQLGIVITKVDEYEENLVKYTSRSSEAGSSGGLMMTLAMYNTLTEKDITKGLKICGTGTIDYDEEIGEIGGVKYKLIGAVKKKCDVFIAPSKNYEEAYKIKKKRKYNIKLIEGKTFKNVIEELENL